MTDVVVLSDSDESVLSAKNVGLTNVDKEKKRKLSFQNDVQCFDSDLDEFEFPEVHFYHTSTANKLSESQDHVNKNNAYNVTPCKSQNVCSSSSATSTGTKSKRHKTTSGSMSDSSDSVKEFQYEEDKGKKGRKGAKTVNKKTKSQLTEERLRRQEQLKRSKALKAIAYKKSKNIKPGECMKFIRVVFDKGIEDFHCKNEILTAILEADAQYSISNELIPNSISWKRNVENSYINEANEICTVTDVEQVHQMLIIWTWNETVDKVADGSFCTTISSIKASLSDYNIILVIFGIEDYFTYKKQSKNSDRNGGKNKTKKTNKSNCEFKNYPEISRQQLELCLNEVQITTKCSSRLVNSSKDLALMIYQCTKAIAEIPYKMEKNKTVTNKFDWYVMGDNRNTVRVDKDGNGLKRLWQQQLCQFNLSSLETAEAICSVYRCPADLIEAYKRCSQNEGLNLLKDIPIRRAAGPLITTRKVGPELSKKMYIMFTSEDGETLLS
nr:crossover junction endonuclease EME1 [Nomia melanderi]